MSKSKTANRRSQTRAARDQAASGTKRSTTRKRGTKKPARLVTTRRDDRFAEIGAFGFKPVQLAILAALVTEDPLLLIGRGGTGKTYLLNSISEALGLEHRHYNASLIAFDDLVGFPYPDDERSKVEFLQTPATVWGAESVLIDEISRCKPEHQNRLFSLVHERRVQGILLDRLRFRWAAMNPCDADQGDGETYTGSEPLDPALADRFALIVRVGDWRELREPDRRLVADPAGEGRIARDGGRLRQDIETWRAKFLDAVERCPRSIIDYAAAVTTQLNTAGIRISPRRARLLARSLLAATLITDRYRPEDFRVILECSLPQLAWGETPDSNQVAAAHRLAWDCAFLEGDEKWLHEFAATPGLADKARRLLHGCPDPDTGSVAIEQFIANEPRERVTAFALAAFPAAVAGRLPVGAEGVNDLGRIAGPALELSGELTWEERLSEHTLEHPDKTRYYQVISGLLGPRRERARQLFYWCLLNRLPVAQPDALEAEFDEAVQVFQEVG